MGESKSYSLPTMLPFYPQIDGSVRKLLKGGKDVDYSLTAVVIRNLKNVKVHEF